MARLIRSLRRICGIPPTRRFDARRAALLLLLAATPAFAGGRQEAGSGAATPEVALPDRLGIAAGIIVAPELDAETRPAVGSAVQIVREIVADIPARRLTDRERRAIAERAHATAVAAAEVSLAAARQSADRARLTRPDTAAVSRELVAERDAVRAVDPADLAVAERLPLAGVDMPVTYRAEFGAPTAVADELGVDLLVVIDAREIDELVLARITLWNRYGEATEIVRAVAPPEELSFQIDERREELIAAIAGEPLVTLDVTVSDDDGALIEDASIALDGELVGFGSVALGGRAPGTYRIVARTRDGRSATRTVTLPETRSVDLRIAGAAVATVRVTSEPEGASVYDGAMWRGKTPIDVTRPAQPVQLTIVQPGWYDGRVLIGPDAPEAVAVELVPRAAQWEREVAVQRDRFYRSMALFVGSLAVPLGLYGAYSDLAVLFPGGTPSPALSDAEADRLVARSRLVFVGYYGGITLSGTALAHMLLRLGDYVQAGQGYHDR